MAEEQKKQWYVVNTYAGHENRVKENLERRVETMGLQDFLFRIVVAEEKEIEYKNGKEVEKTKNPFSGYLFVEMIMTDEAWYIVRNTPELPDLSDPVVVELSLSQLPKMKWKQFCDVLA